ncbi:MAG: protein kinase [Candidatus Lokiarchaeia archaeon]|nr:protein kinase [Candidatus Lokiarchaeia archaeon]
MSKFKTKELEYAKELIENGRFSKASQVLKDFGERRDITRHEQLSYYILICFLSAKLKDNETLQEYAEKAYSASQGQKNSLQLVDVYIVKSMAFVSLHKHKEALTLLSQSEKILESLNLKASKESNKRKAEISYVRANIYFLTRDFDKALEYAEQSLMLNRKHKLKVGIIESLEVMRNIYYYQGKFEESLEYSNKCLSLAEEINYKSQILSCYMHFGIIYAFKGEMNSAIEHYNKALTIAKSIDYKFGIAAALNNLGDLYRKQGKFNLAKETLEKSVDIFKQIGISGVTSIDSLFHLALEEGDLKLAQKYLEQLWQIKDRSKFSYMAYRLDNAVFLKNSPRAINRGKAEEMLKEIVEGEIVDYEITIIALLHLTDLLLYELQNTGEREIIDEIKPNLVKLLDLAEKNHSFPLLAEVYIFRARLALVTLELQEAQTLLTKAQNIAEKYHINNLAIRISTEHDDLLKKINKWEGIDESNTSLSERMQLAGIRQQMEQLIHKRAINPLEVLYEEPIVLLIMGKNGLSYFKYPFKTDWDKSLLSTSFMSALTTLSKEIFSESIDRIQIGENTILINPIESFLVCYVIRGQSYLGKQKLNYFTKALKDDTEIWESLNKAIQTGEELDIIYFPSLLAIINEIFHKFNKTVQFQKVDDFDYTDVQIEQNSQQDLNRDFKLVKFLGEGWSAKVYSCKIKNDRLIRLLKLDPNKLYAIKIYKKEKLHVKNQEKRIQREFRTGIKLKHPNLVKLYYYGLSTVGNPYLLMEFLDGKTLNDFVKENYPIEPDVIIELSKNICSVVNFLNQNKIIHRDIKPDNVMILNNGSIKLMDLGVIKDLSDNTLQYSNQDFLGSIRYSAPEYLLNLDYNSLKMDAYAVGAILYLLIYGYHIFDEEQYFVKLINLKHVHNLNFKRLPHENETLVKLLEITQNLLKKDPDKRLSLDDALNQVKKLYETNTREIATL